MLRQLDTFAWILIMFQQNSHQKCEERKVRWDLSKVLTNTFKSLNLVIFSTLPLNCKMKFRWKFHYGFTNHGYLHCAILKALCIYYTYIYKYTTYIMYTIHIYIYIWLYTYIYDIYYVYIYILLYAWF